MNFADAMAVKRLFHESFTGKARKVVKRTRSSCVNINLRFGSITELWFYCQKWVKDVRLRMTMTARLASAIKKILAKMSRYLCNGRKVLITLDHRVTRARCLFVAGITSRSLAPYTWNKIEQKETVFGCKSSLTNE